MESYSTYFFRKFPHSGRRHFLQHSSNCHTIWPQCYFFRTYCRLILKKIFRQQWKNDDEEGGKNLFEEKFFRAQLKRMGKENLKVSYTKVVNHQAGLDLVNNIHNLLNNDLNMIVYNFVDMLSHARTEMEVLKELAGDEMSYRSITTCWFEHSPLHQALKKIADKKIRIVLATDHGSVRVKTPCKVIGDKQTTTNLRYKHGRNLNYEPKEVLAFP